MTLLYGAGLRVMEGLRLRVKDLDFACDQITVRDGKGQKDRLTMLPSKIKPALQEHVRQVKAVHEGDLKAVRSVARCLARPRPFLKESTTVPSGSGTVIS